MTGKQSDRWYGVVPFGSIFGVLLGTVMLPTVALTTVGILTLVFWREGFDLVFGVIILSFSAASIAGGVLATALVRRAARRAGEQSDFVSSVSHELKTPLTAIQMYAETLLLGRHADESERKECLEHIVRETERLTALIDRLLDVRRLAEGRVFGREALDVSELIDAAVRIQVPELKERGLALKVSVQDDLPPVMGDREALVTALTNLVQNALRYGGDTGKVQVRARRDGRHVVLEVEDEGQGIPRRAMRRLFERFYRVDRDRGRTPVPGGMGLGLAIVRQVTQAHGGRVEVRSQEGEGSLFSMRLPFSKKKRAAASRADNADAERKVPEERNDA